MLQDDVLDLYKEYPDKLVFDDLKEPQKPIYDAAIHGAALLVALSSRNYIDLDKTSGHLYLDTFAIRYTDKDELRKEIDNFIKEYNHYYKSNPFQICIASYGTYQDGNEYYGMFGLS
jgi:hypothetical protein